MRLFNPEINFENSLILKILILTISILHFALCTVFAGSPFYLTVERSFSHTEKPQIRLDYTETDKPMLIRVLRPKNPDRFLDGQLNISRSYEKPITDLNPGYYFVKGLNTTESPLKAFRNMLSPEFRKNFRDTPFQGSILTTTQGDMATAPGKVILAPPDGFTAEREFHLDLQRNSNQGDPGWWFDATALQDGHYNIRTISLNPLTDGIYLVQAVQGTNEAQSLLQISSMSVQVKQSSSQIVVRAVTRDAMPVNGASVSFRDGRGKWTDIGKKTDASGEASFINPEGLLDGKLIIKVQTQDNRQAITDTDFLPTVTNDDSVFIVTDRPIFKPGESFFYKGMIRGFDNGQLKMPDMPDKRAKVTLIRADGTPTDLQSYVSLTNFGSFSGSFDLDEGLAPGLYRLIAEMSGRPYGGEFRVRDYIKPSYYLELIDRSPTVTAGQKFFVKFKAKRFDSGIPKDVKFDVYLYKKKFEIPQWVIEAGGGMSAGADYFGEVRSASALTEPKRIYSSVQERFAKLSVGDANPWDSAPKMDESGEAQFEFVMPKSDSDIEEENIYTLIVRTMDRSGSQSVLSENIYATLSEAQPTVRFSKAVAQVGDKGVTLSVRSTYPDGKPAPKAVGTMDLKLETGKSSSENPLSIRFTTNDQGVSHLRLSDMSKQGRLIAVATLEALDGKQMKRPSKSQPEAMIVGGSAGESVLDNRDTELYTDSTILSPGEKAKVFALLPVNWGNGENGTVWETISGRKVYETNSSVFKGRSRWFEIEAKSEYGTGFYHTVTVPMPGGKYREKTMGFRIIPVDKRLSVTIFPDRTETEPLKPFKIEFEVKDQERNAVPDAELTITVVDRAVYSVQSELRPGVFDFFYPLPRLNLATFYSDELQGYGYADILKKPNFRLGAIKSQSKLPKKGMRDTAGWFPHVMTDAAGRASIVVDLPANVTEWLITAIAADKNGRLGEGKEKFKTMADISVDINAPKFLREGEEADIQIKAVNHLDKNIPIKATIDLSKEAEVSEENRNSEFSIDGKGEHVLPLHIKSKGKSGAATVKVGLKTNESIHIGGAEEFDILLKPAAMKQVFAGVRDNERLVADLPKTADISQIKVEVSSGLLGAALNAASILVSYPYGCTEQLVHSTIPNLVLMDVVKRAGLSKNDLGPLADTLVKAERNASVGIKKIMQNQKTDGSFSLWSSDPEGSVSVTVTAVYALKFAEELKIEGAERAYNKGSNWLDSSEKHNKLTGYELSKIAELGFYDQPWDQQIAFIERVRKTADAPVTDLIYALKIFAASKDKNWNRFQQKFKGISVQKDLTERLKNSLDLFDPEAFAKISKAEFLHNMGFGFGIPYVVSSGMGVLKDLNALSTELETKLKRILILSMKNGYWLSTFDTAQVIFNTRQILSKEAADYMTEKKAKPRTITVRKKDGTALGELTRIPKGFVGIFANPGTAENLWDIRLEGLGNAESAYSTYTANVPFDAITPLSHGLSIERKLVRLTASGSEAIDISKPLRKGDIIVSEIRVKRETLNDTINVPSDFIVIEDGIPSVAQGIEDDKNYLADAKIRTADDSYWSLIKETQRYPDKTVTIAKLLPSGEIRAYQIWQVAFSGQAAIPPAQVFDMYDESVRGNSDALKIKAE